MVWFGVCECVCVLVGWETHSVTSLSKGSNHFGFYIIRRTSIQSVQRHCEARVKQCLLLSSPNDVYSVDNVTLKGH